MSQATNTIELSGLGTEEGQPQATDTQAAAVETTDDRIARLERELGQTNQRVQAQPTVNQLLSDPDVAALIAMKQHGRRVKVIDDIPASPVEEKEEPIDWATLPPEQIAQKVIEQSEKMARKMVRQEMQPLQQKNQQMEQYFTQQQMNEAVRTVEAAKKKYPDFEKFATQISALHNQFEGRVGPEDLYLLARARNGKPAPAEEARTTASERPTHSAARPPVRANPKELNKPALGRAGFNAALDAVLSSLPVPNLTG